MLDRKQQSQLRDAYSDVSECPNPEMFLQERLEGLPADERQRLAEHASGCPRCAAEQRLAQEFDLAATEDAGSRADVEAIIANLVSPVAVVDGGAQTNVRPFPAQRARGWRWNPALAAAAVFALVMVGSLAVWRSALPTLPQPPGDAAVRGSRLELVQPVGDVMGIPTSFEWLGVSDADSYRVRLFEVDRSVLFETMTDETSTLLPQEAAGKVSAAVVYVWQVEALDAAGKRLAWSEMTRFKVKPAAEE